MLLKCRFYIIIKLNVDISKILNAIQEFHNFDIHWLVFNDIVRMLVLNALFTRFNIEKNFIKTKMDSWSLRFCKIKARYFSSPK